jgi:hypothetical protein
MKIWTVLVGVKFQPLQNGDDVRPAGTNADA